MTDTEFDFAIAGSSIFAAVLALLLSRIHSKSVCLIGERPAALQTARDSALSLGPYSRPETLELLTSGVPTLRNLLGNAEIERRNVTFAAFSAAGRDAASHVRHLFSHKDVVTSLLPDRPGFAGFVAEGLLALRPRKVFEAMGSRLAEAGVTSFDSVENLQPGQNLVRFATEHGFSTARQLVVTDASCAACLPELPDAIVSGWRAALLAEPVPALSGRYIVDIETGGHLRTHADGRIEAVAPSQVAGEEAAWLSRLLPPGTTTQIVARKRFPVFLSRDGAPVVASLPRRAVTLALGFGASNAWFAPALAGHLTDSASSLESRWHVERSLRADRTRVADIGMIGGGTA